MKVVLILIGILSATLAGPTQLYLSEWMNFKDTHEKQYTDLEEENLRFEIFTANLEKINKHNAEFEAGNQSWEMGVNQFADMSEEEFLEYLTLSGPNPTQNFTAEVYEGDELLTLPKSVDYRKKKAVTGVKNQGRCGSCWAFSTTGSLEGVYALKKKKLISLSEQNLVDCSSANHGCSGGSMEVAFDYIKSHGIQTEKGYPYKAKKGRCRFNKKKSAVRTKGFVRVKNNEGALQRAIASVGPIAVAVDASQFQHYKKGIFSVKKFSKLNHGVVAVGYGDTKGKQYYIVKNSWGKGWGESGYIRIARNKGNQVGIAKDPSYPKL